MSRTAPPAGILRSGPRPPAPLRDAVRLMRPAQWPILTCQLAVGILASDAAVAVLRGQTTPPAPPWPGLGAAWAAWVVALNGGTLAFNSAHDRDTEDVAYLRRPPQPPRGLAGAALALMLAGTALAWTVSPALAAVTGACVLLSVLYSHPATRWKSVPGLDLAVNMAGYGAGTTLAGLLAGRRLLGGGGLPDAPGWLLTGGFALLFGSFYPLTQLYQRRQDRRRGDRTLAVALGVRRSLDLALLLGVLAAAAILGAAVLWRDGAVPPLLAPAAALATWLALLAVWRRRAERLSDRQHERGMYLALGAWAIVDAAILLARYLPA